MITATAHTLPAALCLAANRNSRPRRPFAKQQPAPWRRRGSGWAAVGARIGDEVEPVPPAQLSKLDSPEALQAEADWLAAMITCWLDEEWAAAELLQVHAKLGSATGHAYRRLRQKEAGMDMGDLVLGLANELMPFDYTPTFTCAFSISNKAVELLMMRQGLDVCCTSESDRTAIQRYETQLAAKDQVK
ncbi:hypothetical protein D9Q98_000307 [Chlorella vulgaris]|uniref:Uncharacterized protein n=1 Tax=Chlorella vulgaris TaxID=3077 RepID=A0A9D4Z220_CHLVU|nr:hypothetical protein D9Q98_000307 [Chlorella vulgaris]